MGKECRFRHRPLRCHGGGYNFYGWGGQCWIIIAIVVVIFLCCICWWGGGFGGGFGGGGFGW